MSRLSDRLGKMVRRGHIAETRLDQLAAAGATGAAGAAATSSELAHLNGCSECRSLLVGYRRAADLLGGAWEDRPLQRGVEIPVGAERVRLRGADRFPAGGRSANRRTAIPMAAVALLVVVVATAGLLTLRGGLLPVSNGGGTFTGRTPQATAHGTPRQTGLVAQLAVAGQVSWSPDGAYLLVASDRSVIYDRFGNFVTSYGQDVGWLDATHLITADGHVLSIGEPYEPRSANTRVVASGHGAAAVIVAMPACVGDPIVDWYKNGGYVRAGEKVTPFGWSPDGKLVLLGHLDCSVGGMDTELHGWKGSVDVVDFASGRVLATAPTVRGEMAFNPSETRLAAQSDADLEIVDIAANSVKTIPGARFLSWLDDDHLYYKAGAAVEMLNLRSGASASAPAPNDEWVLTTPAGPHLVLDASGAARRIVSADWTTTLLDLSAASLKVYANPASDQTTSSVQDSLWSPDGGLLVVPSSDLTSLALFSVTELPGAAPSALPTPIGSPQAISELDSSAVPWPVGGLVADAGRNAFWMLGGDTGKPIDLFRYDVATATLADGVAIDGTVFDEKAPRDSLAIAPDGKLWIGAGRDLIVYDPESGSQTKVALPTSGPDIQTDPKIGQPDPWVAGVAFDAKNGRALVARNWVRSLVSVDLSLKVSGSVDVSDGFAMTGAIVFSGGRVFVVADPATGFGFGVDATGTQTLNNLKFTAPSIAEWGDRLLTGGTPPGFIDATGGGSALIEPVPGTADLVASGPNGVAALYDAKAGAIQLRDAEGKVSGQGTFAAGAAPHIVALTFDGQGRLWALEAGVGASDNSLVRLSFGS